jgi:hypothetical protein
MAMPSGVATTLDPSVAVTSTGALDRCFSRAQRASSFTSLGGSGWKLPRAWLAVSGGQSGERAGGRRRQSGVRSAVLGGAGVARGGERDARRGVETVAATRRKAGGWRRRCARGARPRIDEHRVAQRRRGRGLRLQVDHFGQRLRRAPHHGLGNGQQKDESRLHRHGAKGAGQPVFPMGEERAHGGVIRARSRSGRIKGAARAICACANLRQAVVLPRATLVR